MPRFLPISRHKRAPSVGSMGEVVGICNSVYRSGLVLLVMFYERDVGIWEKNPEEIEHVVLGNRNRISNCTVCSKGGGPWAKYAK